MMQFILRGQGEKLVYEYITVKTPNIFEYCDFNFYDLVWYYKEKQPPRQIRGSGNREVARHSPQHW